jgi:RecA-family ATPase
MTDLRQQEAEFRARRNGQPDQAERERVIQMEEWRDEARTQIAQRKAREAMVLPDTPPTLRLSDELREVTGSPPLHIDGLCGQGHNVVVAAQWKAGKTTIAVERVRAEVDGTPFLGEFATRRLYGNVGFWNNELEQHDMLEYFRRSGVINTGRIAVEHLKGRRVPLLSDIGAEWTIKWLYDREVESWYLDPWAVVCSWSGVNEYLDPEVGPLLERLDAIKRESDVELIHICHHTGRQPEPAAWSRPAGGLGGRNLESGARGRQALLQRDRPTGGARRGLRPARGERETRLRRGWPAGAADRRGASRDRRLRREQPRLQVG